MRQVLSLFRKMEQGQDLPHSCCIGQTFGLPDMFV